MRLVVDNGAPHSRDRQRSALLAQVHIARKALAIRDDDYRALMERVTGHASAKDCTTQQLGDAVVEFARMGFTPRGRCRHRDIGSGAVIRKAQAMWISLYQLGAIDDGSDAALEALGRRQLGVERLRWASEREGFRLIEALKAIADRHGWDQRVPSRMAGPDRVHLLKDRLVGAQLARLAAAGFVVTGPLADDRTGWSVKRLESAAAELSMRIHSIPETA
jgi:phage gp16-like protein